MAEVALAGKHHGEAVLVGRGDDLVVADRSPRLYDRRRRGFDGAVEAVGEREEGVAGIRATGRPAVGLLPGQVARIAPVLLAAPDADGLTVLHEHDGVRQGPGHDDPRQLEV